MSSNKKIDRSFLIIVIILISSGFIIFLSASLGLTAQNNVKFSTIVIKQFLTGIVLGGIVAYITSKIEYTFWKKHSLWIFIFSIFLTLLVFVPGIGLEHGGARRWLLIGPLSFQPSEFLKIAYILYVATFLSNLKKHVGTFMHGIVPFLIISGITGAVFLSQPDTDTFMVTFFAGGAMLFAAGAKWKHILLLMLIGIIGISGLIIARPYIRDRIVTYINQSANPQTSGYQIQQSLIAIGSGGFFGRGFGQSVQKFNFLPEPIGDSIFAVFAEEFGFVGALALVAAFTIFTVKGLQMSTNARDSFGGLVVIGLVILITSQSFMNIGAMLGVIPLAGLPLIFVSHGGTALLFTLFGIGILFNISRYQKK